MILNNRADKIILALLISLFIFLIIPTSLAGENIDVNQSHDVSWENNMLSTSDSVLISENENAIYVNSSTGSSGGDGSINNPVKSISEGLNLTKDGGTIYLNGRFSGEGNCNLTFEGIPDEITFIGVENTVIDGNFTNTFALINNGTYTFNDISFINHYKSDDQVHGGVFQNTEGTLNINNCVFENNIINGTNRGNGGAIDNSGTMTIVDCIFKNNIATVTNSSGFRKNAADGGAISNLGTAKIYNTTFISNVALRNGGAIRTQDGSKTFIDGCNFTDNVAAYHMSGGSYGGAIYTWDCGLNLYNSIFKNNKVYDASGYGARGGALSLNRGIGKIIISSCQFINNTADGIANVDGQSIYFDSVEASVNYCTIDSSIYSISQTVDLNYNWWAVNNSDIKSLIENLPPSAAIKTFAELKISSDAEEIEIGKKINVTVGLYWNGTESQKQMNLIPLRTAHLDATGGILDENSGKLNGGSFETGFTPASKNVLIIAHVDNVVVESNLKKKKEDLEISCNETFEGENATVEITANNNEIRHCLVEVNNVTYYVEINSEKENLIISELKSGNHVATASGYDSKFNKIYETTADINVINKLDSDMNVIVNPSKTPIINVELNENATGSVYVLLNGDDVLNRTIDNNTMTITLENISEGAYSLEVKYSGDSAFASKSAFSGLIIGNPQIGTVIEVSKSITTPACDTNAGEKGGYLTALLKDENNNPLKNKKVQIAFNGKVYERTTDTSGKAKFQISLASANTYTYAISFKGDEGYAASELKSTKVTVSKKSASISASKKTFNAKAKTKTFSVTLKTSKNKQDGKTYLSKGKKITLKVKGKTYTAKTNAKGVAKFNIKITKKGKYTAAIKFAGDKTYKASSKSVKITIIVTNQTFIIDD